MNTNKQEWIRFALAAGLVIAAALTLLPGRGPAPAPRRQASAEAEQAPPAPYQRRVDFPTTPADKAPAPARSSGLQVALAQPPTPPAEIPVSAAVSSPAQTGTAWATDYRDAICACRTRDCVRDAQQGFIHRLTSTTFVEERDSGAYAQALRQAIRCYASLPDDL